MQEQKVYITKYPYPEFGSPYQAIETMTFAEAFGSQIETTRTLIEEDFIVEENPNPVVWNGVIIRPDGNHYSSGTEMKVGDKLLVAHIVHNTDTPSVLLLEKSEIPFYEKIFKVLRLVQKVPVLIKIDQSNDQYNDTGEVI